MSRIFRFVRGVKCFWGNFDNFFVIFFFSRFLLGGVGWVSRVCRYGVVFNRVISCCVNRLFV